MKKPFKKPEPGDKISVKINNKEETGTLLESHDPGVLLLKLESGYNIGLKREEVSEIKVLKKRKKQEKKEELKMSGKKPIIDFYLTGGTISSKLDPETGGVKWLIDAKELFGLYPELFDVVDVRVKSPFMKASENMDSKDWIRLAKLVGKSLNDENVKGVIVSHGTDFLHYTSAALSFMLGKVNKPVVLTYSQRSSDRGSSDSRLNLICSAYAALSDIAEVMLVGHASMNDDFCFMLQGNKVRKMHTSRRDTFRPINCKPIAKVFPDGKIEMINNDVNKRGRSDGKIKVDAVFDNRVALIKFYPGQSPDILNYYKKKACRGLVIEMSGLGHVLSEGKNNWLPVLKKLIKKGMFVYAAPQTLYGRLDPYVYSPGRKLQEIGVNFLGDILPECALVKLGWVLGHPSWRGSVSTKLKMLENVNGEFNERLGSEFLI
ncbi:MAG: Glu-tRNA(Gln) amidotransferase subunit GatD [Candidatus Nanoarchaeia archaeon]|nr:Glu-tRNA(Gln) amidotransferase subunit GatD [Candidatus Nanoarchaeia archaeon]MDD5741537.1 Glu-tRNA(Gln) amidotransferase subunit GatD [Candidatus Nanoarchaeia archaeon]